MRNRKHSLFTFVVFALVLVASSFSARSQPQTQGNPPSGTSPAQAYFTDIELISQDNQTVRLYSDLLKGRVVVINSFYATEHDGCTSMFLNLEKLQTALGDRVGKDVSFVSITVDPLIDTPSKLKAFAQRFRALPGWSFITGKKENVEFALKKLGMSAANKDDHSMILIIGNERTGLWKKVLAMARTEDLTKVVLDVLNDK